MYFEGEPQLDGQTVLNAPCSQAGLELGVLLPQPPEELQTRATFCTSADPLWCLVTFECLQALW